MKAIKDCELEVHIYLSRMDAYTYMAISSKPKQTPAICAVETFSSIRKAKNNFIKLAKLNNITKYKFI